MLAQKTPYTIKDPTQKFVAGQRRPTDGKPMMLTPDEARLELQLGNIEPFKEELPAPQPALIEPPAEPGKPKK